MVTDVEDLARPVNRSRKVFFVTLYYDEDCLTPVRRELVVASRRQAKKAIRYVRSRCLEFHDARIDAARQRDLRFTGWMVNRSGAAGTRSREVCGRPGLLQNIEETKAENGLAITNLLVTPATARRA